MHVTKPLSIVVLLALAACGPSLTAGEGEGEVGEGEGERAPIDVGAPPAGFTTAAPAGSTSCSTDQWWNLGDRESETMHPGIACIDCHTARREGPRYTYAGTAFQALDDEDDCRGIAGAVIDIIDSDGNVAFSMTTNNVGNFSSRAALVSPYTARITYEGRTAEMVGPQTDGDCNRCHTAAGIEDAPGRVLIP